MKTLSRKSPGSKLPVISLSTAAISLLLYFWDKGSSVLQYDYNLIAEGELWRCITGHWTHWSFDHFLWCTLTFIALGSLCEQRSRKGFIIVLSASAIIIPTVCWLAAPSLLHYRGLSGLGSGIFIYTAILTARHACVEKDWFLFNLSVGAGLAFTGKVLFEYISEHALFVNNPELFTPVPLVHLTGGAVGLVLAFIFREKNSQSNKMPENSCS